MNKILLALIFSFVAATANAQTDTLYSSTPNPKKKIQVVEASCGQCQFGLTGKGCDLAVRINGKAYYVDGTKIDDHGDAHAQDGFCEAVRTAKVQGEVVNGRFKATYFKLVKAKKGRG
ncbi:MAG: hypothetical protein JNM68_09540 [Dinghuibacter sp.]|nr:hypothetical protein [Dinghuibacter sp.]